MQRPTDTNEPASRLPRVPPSVAELKALYKYRKAHSKAFKGASLTYTDMTPLLFRLPQISANH
jgi:hypothetical protein